MNETEFWQALRDMPEPASMIFRLYHQDGIPLFYSMEDLPGTYINIDADTFALGDMHVRVKNGKLVKAIWKTTSKLVPSDSGTMCHPHDVTIVVKEDGEYWSKRTYESN